MSEYTTFQLLVNHFLPSADTNKYTDFFLTGLRNIFLYPTLPTESCNVVRQKHKSLHQYIRSGICFVPIEKREEIFAIFTTIQKHYMSFLKFYNVCKFKFLSKRVGKQYDLYFNDLDDCGNNSKFHCTNKLVYIPLKFMTY